MQEKASDDIDFSGVTFKATTSFGFVPRYIIHIPHKTLNDLRLAKDIAKACSGLAGVLAPMSLLTAAALLLFAAWLAAELLFIQWADKGNGVNLVTWLSPLQPYWIPTAA